MKFTATFASICASIALAAPTVLEERQYQPCSGLPGSAQCCATDVLGIADLDCDSPPSAPTNATNFRDICAAIGQQAQCCVLPILQQGIICKTPTGVSS